jgi:hypothetical protein
MFSGSWVSALRFMVSGEGFGSGFYGLWSMLSVFGFMVSGVCFMVSGFGIRDSDFGSRDSGFGIRDSGFGFRDAGFGIRVSGGTLTTSLSRFGFPTRFRVYAFAFRLYVLCLMLPGFGVMLHFFMVSGFGFRVGGIERGERHGQLLRVICFIFGHVIIRLPKTLTAPDAYQSGQVQGALSSASPRAVPCGN